MKRRFAYNIELLTAVYSDEIDMDINKIKYLKNININILSKEEIFVVQKHIQKKKEEKEQRTAFQNTYELLASARTFSCSTVLCESSFSVLTRINRPQRLGMTHQRMSNLV